MPDRERRYPSPPSPVAGAARAWVACVTAAYSGACGSGGGDGDDVPVADAGDRADGATSSEPDAASRGEADAAPDAATSCQRTPAAADRVRRVVVSYPFAPGGKSYEVLTLSEAGDLSEEGTAFEMGAAGDGKIAFTPDGEVGIVAQADGTLGVFSLDDAGVPSVIHAAHGGEFYADEVTIDPSGETAFVIDSEARAGGGGIYALQIGCDGALSGGSLLIAATFPTSLLAVPGAPGRALLVAIDALDSPMNLNAHLLAWEPAAPAWIAGSDAFADDLALPSRAAVTRDGLYALVGDKFENRIGVVQIGPDSVQLGQPVAPFEDPYESVASPFADDVLAVSGFGDALFLLSLDGGDFRIAGELTYEGPRPLLPGRAAPVERGALRGLVLIAELGFAAVRRVRFLPGGGAEDLGRTAALSGVGAIGVQP